MPVAIVKFKAFATRLGQVYISQVPLRLAHRCKAHAINGMNELVALANSQTVSKAFCVYAIRVIYLRYVHRWGVVHYFSTFDVRNGQTDSITTFVFVGRMEIRETFQGPFLEFIHLTVSAFFPRSSIKQTS